eukprot:NODE_337_length_10662_cov_0.497207.p6 type:complete len:182 gc:universal NODE_337_length_10662_cov_0.497207:10099-9554(-)
MLTVILFSIFAFPAPQFDSMMADVLNGKTNVVEALTAIAPQIKSTVPNAAPFFSRILELLKALNASKSQSVRNPVVKYKPGTPSHGPPKGQVTRGSPGTNVPSPPVTYSSSSIPDQYKPTWEKIPSELQKKLLAALNSGKLKLSDVQKVVETRNYTKGYELLSAANFSPTDILSLGSAIGQ